MNCSKNFIRDKCNNHNDLTCERKCNISKMQELYNKELEKYYNEYNKYLQYKYDRSSDKSRKKMLAESVIRPNIIKINNNLNNILIRLRKHIGNTNKLVLNQKNLIKNKNNNIVRQNKKIQHQMEILNKSQNEVLSKKRQIDTGLDRNRYKRNIMYVILIVNILLFKGGDIY